MERPITLATLLALAVFVILTEASVRSDLVHFQQVIFKFAN